jgi:ComF family protein
MFRYILEILFPSPSLDTLFASIKPCESNSEPGIYSLFKYKDPHVRKALWMLKYNGNKAVATFFAKKLHEYIIENQDFVNPLLIPAPLSDKRLRERGWNQSEMICNEIIKINPRFELNTSIIKKVRHTTPQTKLNREERLQNLQGCFEIMPNRAQLIQSRSIIVIDDVTTTGSTIIEIRKTLLTAGAQSVVAFTMAH